MVVHQMNLQWHFAVEHILAARAQQLIAIAAIDGRYIVGTVCVRAAHMLVVALLIDAHERALITFETFHFGPSGYQVSR